RPLGWACGTALETEEAIHALRGEGPPDLMTVTYALASEMLRIGGIDADLERAIASGTAAEKFQEIIAAQGGNPSVVDDPAVLPQAKSTARYGAPREGVIARVEPRAIGLGIQELGKDPAAGFVITVKPGDRVERDQPIATIYASDAGALEKGRVT